MKISNQNLGTFELNVTNFTNSFSYYENRGAIYFKLKTDHGIGGFVEWVKFDHALKKWCIERSDANIKITETHRIKRLFKNTNAIDNIGPQYCISEILDCLQIWLDRNI